MPELFEELVVSLGIQVHAQGALRLVKLQDALRIVEACKAGRLLILGIEAFRLSEGNVIPETDFIADFSDLTSKEWDIACLQAAISAQTYFCAIKGRTDMWFDFTLRGLL